MVPTKAKDSTLAGLGASVLREEREDRFGSNMFRSVMMLNV
jgi:hypothetical protein